MKNMIKIFATILLIANLYKCENIPYKRYDISLMNNSEHSIGCYFALGGNFGTYYPDTLLPATNHYIINEIKSGKIHYYDSGIKWEEIFFNLPKDTLSVFIFHTDTLTEYTWNEVRDKYMILKRYDLSLDDLRRLNFKITYPPNEIMDNIKMYPPRSVEAVR